MTKGKLYLRIQAALWILLCALLIAGAIGLYRDGLRLRAEAGPSEPIYTRQRIVERLAPIVPLFFIAVGTTAAGLIMGVRGAEAGRPAKGPRAPKPAPVAGRATAALRIALLVAALSFIVAGALNGSMRDVLYKAISICTECVGLG